MSVSVPRILLPLLLTALLVFVVGCGSSSSSSSSTQGTIESNESTETAAAGSEEESLAGQNLVFVNYGGDGAEAAKAAWLEPFAAETGVEYTMEAPSDPAKVKAMVEAGNTTWDVIDLDPATAKLECGKLFEPRDPKVVDISKIDPKYITNECGVPIILQTEALVYNKKLFGNDPPTSITDFMNLKKYPGKRLLFNYSVGSIEPLLMADGVKGEELYPLDLDRAAEAVKTLGSNLKLTSSLTEQNALQESGEFAMCLCYLGRSAIAAENGAEIGIVWNGVYEIWDELLAIKGSKSPAAQQALLNYVAQPEAQAAFTEQLPYGTTTPSSKPKLSPAFEEFQSQGKVIGTPGVFDAEWWAEHLDEANTAWTEMTAG